MKVLNYVAQILAAIVYTGLYVGLIYVLFTYPVMWLTTLLLPWWGILIVFILLGGITYKLIVSLATLATMPYLWIARKNIVATFITIIEMCILFIYNIWNLWQNVLGSEVIHYILGAIVSLLLVQVGFVSIHSIITIYEDENYNE